MARVEIRNLEGRTTRVTKDPSEYFAEWRTMIAEGRERREQARLARLDAVHGRHTPESSRGLELDRKVS